MSPADPNYVAHRQREIAHFEARAAGRIPHRSKQHIGADTMLHHADVREDTSQASSFAAPPPSRRVHQDAEVTIHTPAVRPQSLLDIILTAGADKNFDVEKFARLVQIQREEQDRQDTRADRAAELEAEAAFDAALSEAQGRIGPIIANQNNSQTKRRYADYAALDRVIRPIYAPAGFSLSFDEEDSPKPEHIRVVCWVTHVAAGAKRSHKRKYHADMPADGKGARGGDVMTRTHATGAAFTYGKRYVACNIFNIAIDRDDDGNAATAAKPVAPVPETGCISAEQAAQIRKLLEERKIAARAFLNFIRLPSIEHIGVEHFDRALAAVKNFGARS
jgi:ERF superfamily protein